MTREIVQRFVPWALSGIRQTLTSDTRIRRAGDSARFLQASYSGDSARLWHCVLRRQGWPPYQADWQLHSNKTVTLGVGNSVGWPLLITVSSGMRSELALGQLVLAGRAVVEAHYHGAEPGGLGGRPRNAPRGAGRNSGSSLFGIRRRDFGLVVSVNASRRYSSATSAHRSSQLPAT